MPRVPRYNNCQSCQQPCRHLSAAIAYIDCIHCPPCLLLAGGGAGAAADPPPTQFWRLGRPSQLYIPTLRQISFQIRPATFPGHIQTPHPLKHPPLFLTVVPYIIIYQAERAGGCVVPYIIIYAYFYCAERGGDVRGYRVRLFYCAERGD